MTTLQDILGLITKRKIKTPSDNDYIISAAYTDAQERLKPQPKMEASLLSIGAIKKYIISSIAPPKYKVFTALVTQSGESNAIVKLSGEVTKGVTYTIQGNNGDFSNVGAPNNNLDTSFIATNNAIPNNYGTNGLVYNTAAPIATVLDNTIGNVWFTYKDPGTYALRSNDSFTLETTVVFNSTFYNPTVDNIVTFSTATSESNTENRIILTTSIAGDPSVITDNLITIATLLEVRIYN